MSTPFSGKALGVVVCAAGPAGHVAELVTLAQDNGWRVELIATPAAVDFLDLPALEGTLGQPVRTRPRFRSAESPRSLPPASAYVVAPATFNTVNKLAAGIADNHALTVLAEAIGRAVPTIVVPFVNTAYAGRAPFVRAVAALREEGVRVIFGEEDDWAPHPPRAGSQRLTQFPWATALREAEVRCTSRP